MPGWKAVLNWDFKCPTLSAAQSNAKTSTSQGSSCSASDRDDGGGGQWAPNGGEWDVSGTPNDYTFTARTRHPASFECAWSFAGTQALLRTSIGCSITCRLWQFAAPHV